MIFIIITWKVYSKDFDDIAIARGKRGITLKWISKV
jgi:hypothetical protein